jgi:hypothetical protein
MVPCPVARPDKELHPVPLAAGPVPGRGRGSILAVSRPVDTDVPRASSAGSLDHVCHVRPPWTPAALDKMLEPGTDSRLQPTPLPNTKAPLTCDFMISIVATFRQT